MDEQMDAMGNSSGGRGGRGGGGGEGEGGGTNKYSGTAVNTRLVHAGSEGINGDVHAWSCDRSSSEIHVAK